MKKILPILKKKSLFVFCFLLFGGTVWAATPYPMLNGNFYEDFSDIANWTDNFAAGTGANFWSSVAVNTTGTVGDGIRISTSTATFQTSGTNGGLQRGSLAANNTPGTIVLLSTGTSSACAIDLLLDFTDTEAGTLTFDAAMIANSATTRVSWLKVFYSTNGTSFTELTATNLPYRVNGSSCSQDGATITVDLPQVFDNCSTAILRFYSYSTTAACTESAAGNQAKVVIDNVTVTTTQSTSPVATPTFDPPAGTYTETQNVTIVCTTPNATIYYTLDNTEPTAASTEYENPIPVVSDVTIKAIAIADGLEDSEIEEASYFIRSCGVFVDFESSAWTGTGYAARDVNDEWGQWRVAGVVTTGDANDRSTSGRSIRFRGNTSDINDALNRVEMRFDRPNGIRTVMFDYASYGTHQNGVINLDCSTDQGATWTNVGSVNAPSWAAGGSVMQRANFTVNVPESARIRITKQSQSGTIHSVNIDDICITDYFLSVAPVTFSHSTNTYYAPISLTMHSDTEGAIIRYTLDGSEPTETSTIYVSSLNIDTTTTVRAKAWKTGMASSGIQTATFTFPIPIPPQTISMTWNAETSEKSFSIVASNGRNFTVDWGDGSLSTTLTGTGDPIILQDVSHIYAEKGAYTVTITGACEFSGFYCTSAQVTNLDVSQSSTLLNLYCNDNQLTTLDVSTCISLLYLYCQGNALTSLMLNNAALLELDCSTNALATLNVSGCSALAYLWCYNNHFPLSQLYPISETIVNPNQKWLGAQTLSAVALTTGVPYGAGENEFNDIITAYAVISSPFGTPALENTNYTVDNGLITFLLPCSYEVTMTNAAIVSDASRQAKVIVEIEVSQTAPDLCGTGSGTTIDPYIICTPEQLNAIRNNLTAHYKLNNNIDLSEFSSNRDGTGWLPIGTSDEAFTGSLNGAGYSITGLFINRSDADYTGLFGYLGAGALIEYLSVEIAAGGVNGAQYVGGIAGYNNSAIITNCYTTGNVTGTGTSVGGLVGYNTGNALIAYCYAAGNITGVSAVGGLAGNHNASTGEPVIKNCVAANAVVTATQETDAKLNRIATSDGTLGTLINNYANDLMIVHRDDNPGAIGKIGPNNESGSNGAFDDLLTEDFYTNGNNWDGGTGWDFNDIWQICERVCLPYFKWQGVSPFTPKKPNFFCGGAGTVANPWLICTAAQLDSVHYFRYKHYKLANDIDDMSEYLNQGQKGYNNGAWWFPIGDDETRFTGSINGDCYKITGLRINRPSIDHIGLFGFTDEGAQLWNIGLIIGEDGITGNQNVGSLVGQHDDASIIENCYATGGEITGNGNNTGGLVGQNNAEIANSYATVNVTGALNAGGFAGYNNANASIAYSHASGEVTGTDYIGGFVGQNHAASGFTASIKNCIAANISISTTSGTGTIHRIGFNSANATLSHNYANEAISVNGVTVDAGDAHNNADGASTSLPSLFSFDFYNTESNWSNNTPWSIANELSTTAIWKICDGENLPFSQCQTDVACEELSTYTICFNAGNGEFETGTFEGEHTCITEESPESGIILPEAKPSEACRLIGYIFAGWATDPVENETILPDLFLAGSIFYPESDATLYAVYVKGKSEVTASLMQTEIQSTPNQSAYGAHIKIFSGTSAGTISISGIDVIYDNTDNLYSTNPDCPESYTITTIAGEGGSIDPEGPVTVNHGEEPTFTIIPDPCFETDSVFVDGEPVELINGTYTFTDVRDNHIIEARFKMAIDTTKLSESICDRDSLEFYGRYLKTAGVHYETLSAVNTCDSVIEMNLTVNPTYLTQISATIYEDEPYDFFGETLTDAGTYFHTLSTIHGCDSVFKLTLTVEASHYTITANAGTNGTITPPGTTPVHHGDNQTFTFEAALGCTVYQLIVDGVDVVDSIAGGSYTFTNVTGNHFISVSFTCGDNCPDNVIDVEGNMYTVTDLEGRCWTSNMRTKTYPNGITPVPFARAYQSTQYPDGDANAGIFGLLYDWHSAVGAPPHATYIQGICPDGWHIPTREEWLRLAPYPAKQLKSIPYWIVPGTDDYDFTALPAGFYDGATHRFIDLFGATGFWSSIHASAGMAHAFFLHYYCEYLRNLVTPMPDGLSVRCVMDCQTIEEVGIAPNTTIKRSRKW
ncbi:MAG: chitobiase/beta-hexosaminidase C-terminal domain-containing protein [Lentimicrobiaceae bacterium]|nr:chitobiase/beta-hexosaminidase C-terminal domain-containing protein [Lentimicrobiaceae bacterium]